MKQTLRMFASITYGLVMMVTFSIAGESQLNNNASFHMFFDPAIYYNPDEEQDIRYGVLSGNGKVLAFGGMNRRGGQTQKLFIHQFESYTDPTEVSLGDMLVNTTPSPRLVSNKNGSRIFFYGWQKSPEEQFFAMLNGHTGDITKIYKQSNSDNWSPWNLATDSTGNNLYFSLREDLYSTEPVCLFRININGEGTGRLECLIKSIDVMHPEGGSIKHIGNFSVSDDGQTIVFIGEGRIEDNGTVITTGRELFVKTLSGIRNITHNDKDEYSVTISGDGSTIVFNEGFSGNWMVTSSEANPGEERNIEIGYRGNGVTPGITQNGDYILARSGLKENNAFDTYLINTDGSGRKMIDPPNINIREIYRDGGNGMQLSKDGKRILFSSENNKLYVGNIGSNIWEDVVPLVNNVIFASDMYTKLEKNEQFNIEISVNDMDSEIVHKGAVSASMLSPNNYPAQYANMPVAISSMSNTEATLPNLYIGIGWKGPGWPQKTPINTVRFSVEDDDGNIGYVDTKIPSLLFVVPTILYPLLF